MKLLNFGERKRPYFKFYVDYVQFVIRNYEFDFFILATYEFTGNTLGFVEDYGLAIYGLALVQSDFLKSWVFIDSVVPTL